MTKENSSTRQYYLAPGCATPEDSKLDAFYSEAIAALPLQKLPPDYQVRWIGANDEVTRNILDLFRSGDKTGSVTLPDVVKHTGQPEATVGDTTILINFDGSPGILIRTIKIEEVAFGEITEEHTALDGPKVRALDVWLPLHEPYFNMLLAPAGKTVQPDTPIWFETFEVLYG